MPSYGAAGSRKASVPSSKSTATKSPPSYIGFLNQKTYQCHLYEMARQNSEEVLKAFDTSLDEYPDKHVCVVWDNAPSHKSKRTREQLKKHVAY